MEFPGSAAVLLWDFSISPVLPKFTEEVQSPGQQVIHKRGLENSAGINPRDYLMDVIELR